MRPGIALLVAVLVLTGCDPSAPSRRDPATETRSEPGIKVSGYGRVGVAVKK